MSTHIGVKRGRFRTLYHHPPIKKTYFLYSLVSPKTVFNYTARKSKLCKWGGRGCYKANPPTRCERAATTFVQVVSKESLSNYHEVGVRMCEGSSSSVRGHMR